MKFKKIFPFIAAIALTTANMPAVTVQAEDTDYSNTTYWTEKCSDLTKLSSDDKNACAAFVQYMTEQSASLSQKLIDIDNQRNEVSANIDKYKNEVSDYQNQIESLGTQIDDLQSNIDTLQSQITDLESKEEDLRDKIKLQLKTSQGSMRLSKAWDLLMGAKSFTDFLNIFNGLKDIAQHSDATVKEYNETVQKLQDDQQELTDNQTELQSKKEDAVAAQYTAQMIQEEYENQKSDLDDSYEDTQEAQVQLNATADELAQSQAAAQAAFEEEQAKAAAAKAAAEAAAKAAAEEAARQQAQQQQQNQNNTGGQTGQPVQPSQPTTPANNNTDLSDAESYELGVEIVQYALQFEGTPYVWGANGPSSFDCSGFTKYVYGHFGIYIARYSETQDTYGYAIDESQARAGDLVHWPGHVGIVSGWGLYNGQYVPYTINALNPQYGVCNVPVPMIRTDSGYQRDYRRLF